MENILRIIITGGPGTGKSTLIELLKGKGYTCHQEISRDLIKKERAKGSDAVPWDNVSAFSKMVFDGQITQYHRAKEGLNFYDRSIIDVIAYLRRAKLPSDAIEGLVQHYPYHTKVFLTPPWEEIFKQDEERREDFEAMNHIHHTLLHSYREFGYEVIEVPKDNSYARIKFILDHLNVE